MNLSIKNAPEATVARLRERATRNHRSLQGELMAIVEAAVQAEPPARASEVYARIKALGLSSRQEAVDLVRAGRDRDEASAWRRDGD